MNNRPDFIDIRLSAAIREQFGQDSVFRVANAHSHYVFTGTEPVEVLRRAEWLLWLQKERIGETLLFEEATDHAQAPAPALEAPAPETHPEPNNTAATQEPETHA